LLLWKVAGKMIISNPLLGVGNQNFSKAVKSYSTEFLATTDPYLYNMTFGGADTGNGLSHTHNTLLNILVEGGLITLVPFTMLFVIPMWRGYNIARRSLGRYDQQIELIVLLSIGIAGFHMTAIFGNLLLLDFYYWNLTILYLLVSNYENRILQTTDCALVKY